MKTPFEYMFFPGASRNDLHRILLIEDPRITRVTILDYKNFTHLPPHTIQIFIHIRWLEETKAERVKLLLQLKERVASVIGMNIQFGLDIVEDFEFSGD